MTCLLKPSIQLVLLFPFEILKFDKRHRPELELTFFANCFLTFRTPKEVNLCPNFISSLLYLLSAYGLLTSKAWTAKTLGASAIILTVAFVGFQFYIQSGGIHENKTIGALIFRITLTLGFALFAYFVINRKGVRQHEALNT